MLTDVENLKFSVSENKGIQKVEWKEKVNHQEG